MLVLTRKIDEQILIGDDIKITLIRVRGNTVRLGIEAPRDVRIVRSELELKDGTSPDGDEQIGDREQAFAHPPTIHREQSSSADLNNQLRGDRRPVAVEPTSRPLNRITSATTPSVFVGRVARDGSQPELKRAPLASFVAAG